MVKSGDRTVEEGLGQGCEIDLFPSGKVQDQPDGEVLARSVRRREALHARRSLLQSPPDPRGAGVRREYRTRDLGPAGEDAEVGPVLERSLGRHKLVAVVVLVRGRARPRRGRLRESALETQAPAGGLLEVGSSDVVEEKVLGVAALGVGRQVEAGQDGTHGPGRVRSGRVDFPNRLAKLFIERAMPVLLGLERRTAAGPGLNRAVRGRGRSHNKRRGGVQGQHDANYRCPPAEPFSRSR